MRTAHIVAGVVAGATLLLAGCSEDMPSGGAPAPGGDVTRHAPAAVPDGMRLCLAVDLPIPGIPEAPETERMSVWGDAARTDPWSGRVAVVYRRPADEFRGREDARPARVGGRRADVAPMPLFQAISSAGWGHIATWRRPDGEIIELALRGGSPAATVAMANRLRVTDDTVALPGSALGDRTEQLYEGPGAQEDAPGWRLDYASAPTGSAAAPGERITITGGPADPDVARLSALFAVRSEATEVGGAPATGTVSFDAEDGPFGLVWTTGGTTISVGGMPGRPDRVRAIAESLRPVGDEEWRRLAESVEDCFGDAP